jgi:hypothetical protein
LRAEHELQLKIPFGGQFQASGLLRTSAGELLTINDRSPLLYRIEVSAGTQEAALTPISGCFSPAQMAAAAPTPTGRYDCEGIAQDSGGRFYICEEANRWILRCDPANQTVERLAIDWSPVAKYFSSDNNASFEGIAIGDGNLYVANERSSPVIIMVDLATLRVVDSFVVTPTSGSFLGILHYADLSWHNGHLFVLCRHHRVILEVEPRTRRLLAEFDYREIEDRLGYRTRYPTGIMEGLTVDDEHLWLVTDNNGMPRGPAGVDTRPTLIRCRRPDATSVRASQCQARLVPVSTHVP